MQTHGGLNAEEAILGSERRVYVSLTVDWDRNGSYNHYLSDLSPYADNIEVDRSLTGSAPQEITLIEGSAAAELTFDLGGNHVDGRSWVATFSPYNGDSLLYGLGFVGAEVKYKIGIETALGIVWYDQFVGNIRTVSPNRESDTVQISALDRVEKLRRPIFMTDWGILDRQANSGFITSQLMSSHWVIDHCLKHSKTSTSPWRWAEPEQMGYGAVQLFISGNAGIAPNVGWVDGSYLNQFPDTDVTPALTMYQDHGQPHASSPEPAKRPQILRAQRDWGNDKNIYWARDRDKVNEDFVTIIGFTLHIEDYAGSQWFTTMPTTTVMEWQPKEGRKMRVMMGAGQVWIQIENTITPAVWNGTHLNIPTTGSEFVRIVAEYDIINQARLRVRRPGFADLTTGIQTVAVANTGWSFHELTGSLTLRRVVSMQDITIGTHDFPGGLSITEPAEAGVAAEYVAVLDNGLNALSFLPNRRGYLAWDVVTEVAAAEFGAVFWDESGVFKFWNQDTIAAKRNLPVRTFSIDQVQGLQMSMSTDSVRNVIAVTSKRGRVQEALVYESQGPDEYYAQPVPGDNLTVLWLDNVVTPNSGRPPILAHPEQTTDPSVKRWSDLIKHGVVRQEWNTVWANAWTHFTENNPSASFGLWMYRGPNGETILRYNEGFTTRIRFAVARDFTNAPIPEGTSSPAFRWDGSKMNFFDDTTFTVKNSASITDWGAQGLQLAGDWYQEFYNRNGMLDSLLLRTADPIPTTDAITVPGDPRMQLGDAIKIVDPEGFGEELQMQVFGITRRFSREGGLVDTLTVELTEPTQVGIFGSPQYGRLGETFYFSS